MTETPLFNGFPKSCVQFLNELRQNNNKLWFDEHDSDFKDYVMEPARDFVVAMGAALQKIIPGIYADPRINRSIFRIHRDTRFSRDKTPYKTHLALWFWEGKGPRLDCSGFYFHLEPPTLMLGAGIYIFSKNNLKAYREAIVDSKHGPALNKAIQTIADHGGYAAEGVHYKRVPRGYDPDHERAELLKHNGLYIGAETPIPDALYTADIIPYCLERYKEMAPLHQWLFETIEAVTE
jgi:uncharacterized protein (TIGR02453 family)